jgi:hypothetical protein
LQELKVLPPEKFPTVYPSHFRTYALFAGVEDEAEDDEADDAWYVGVEDEADEADEESSDPEE